MDQSTTIFVICIIIGFFMIKWFFKGEAHPSLSSTQSARTTNFASNGTTSGNTGSSTNNNNVRNRRRPRRVVTQDMIEVVQSLAPYLTVDQIQYDLEKTGSVEATVDNVLRDGSLPFPPGYQAPAPTSPTSTQNNSNNVNVNGSSTIIDPKKISNIKSDNLLTKYNVDPNEDLSSWNCKELSIEDKKKYMVWKARKNLEKELGLIR
ncbi:Cue1p SCDLUD_001246 [Saccharomycodes ludwigii]|uniref:Cue1p n=1 Tax=Saccharomycodes ludwigii TaxID=36035 RepID=UPI001E8B3CF3|nr:hypothetical protein SCDLUD_001246 [Saccharomycodes ludwigii]KAH3903602.1 hypothetical protein SCDLUD_001246 [Saccharomycodes ludwigii]